MAKRLQKSGGDVTLETWEKTPHAWQFFGAYLPEAKDALEKAAAFLQTHLRP